MRDFEDKDFPLTAVGRSIYRKTEREPIATCVDTKTASDLVRLLNRGHALLERS